jgi:tRNA pseudouridine32 synthase/23S rRNA pseudouridine746 synthase
MNAKLTPAEMVARLLYRDGLMLVIDKPAGIAVHKGPKGGESLEDHLDALRFGLPRRPALAHRLDHDTSGCLVLGRHRKALATLGRLFKNGQVGKTYWAVVEGEPPDDEGRIDLPLGRKDATRGWWMKPDPHGQPATTLWKVMGRSQGHAAAQANLLSTELTASFPPPLRRRDREGGNNKRGTSDHPSPHPSPTRGEGAGGAGGIAFDSHADEQHRESLLTWLALTPLTGRTHQLRVHCAAMGWPIVGDCIYGHAPRDGGPPLHLHAREIVVPLYKNKAPIAVTAPAPLHMQERLYACGWTGEVFQLID